MRTARWVVLAPLLLAWPAGATTSGPRFSGAFDLLVVMDSPWGPHCETTVTVDERAQGKIRNACRTGAGPVALKEWTLRSADVDRLRRLVRRADLFGKVSEGHDARGIDLALVTLRAAAEGQTVEVICLVNPDFRSAGPRKDLLDQLMSWQGETGTPGVTDVGAAEPDNGAAEARKESVQ